MRSLVVLQAEVVRSSGKVSSYPSFTTYPLGMQMIAPGLAGLLVTMEACVETRVEALRLFVADTFLTSNQVK